MDAVLFRERGLEEQSGQQDLGFRPPAELETAIGRSQSYLLSEQKAEGYWIGELMVDATIVSDLVASRHWHGKVGKPAPGW